MLYIKDVLVTLFIIILISSCSAQSTGGLSVMNNPEAKKQDETRVIITKTLNTIGPMKLIYNITTPPVDLFDFILALDSSGSMGNFEEKGTMSNAVSLDVPRFIENIPTNYPGRLFNVSIVSWNENANFIYSKNKGDPFLNKNISNAALVEVKRAARDIATYPIFHKDPNNISANPHYYPTEYNLTDFSIPLKTSLGIFNEIKNPDFYRISRFIILVTGSSEFHPDDNQSLKELTKLGIPVYVIAMNVYENIDPKLYRYLWKIANDNPDQIRFISVAPEQLEPQLQRALEDTLNKAVSRPVARKVTINDTLYSYLKPNIKDIEINGKLAKTINESSNINSEDNTTTITFELSDKLLPESNTFVTIPINFSLRGLPISVVKSPTLISLNPKVNKSSLVNYVWFNEKWVYSEVPEGHMSIESNYSEVLPRSNVQVRSGSRGSGFWSFLGSLSRLLVSNPNN